MPKFKPVVEPVFSKALAAKAIWLARQNALLIIEPKDFPAGVALHEDGSTEYDPKKPFVIFAVRVSSWEGHREWQDAVEAYNAEVTAARAA